MSNLTAGLAAFEAKNYHHAFKLLKPIAERGDAEAQCVVANIYHLGLGLERNVLEAVNWYKKSAAQGYGVASNNLGTILTIGEPGLSVDRIEAERWYQKARKQDFYTVSNNRVVEPPITLREDALVFTLIFI
ncbi:MAG: sel1 repeat family protein [Chroococcus sp. CMT-3BRIN-NPC107]|jgi:TPR repeat protein|nr:sel1 repeat family protein [Chroococcus sp. CMT-3BRIN-NPC107]